MDCFDPNDPHHHSVCEGNCSFHPLMRSEYMLSWADLNDNAFILKYASETPDEKEQRLKIDSAEKQDRALTREALVREQYAQTIKEKAQMGLKKNEKPKKIQQPCKWVVGHFIGEECWAYEYTDPKTGQRECPRTCQRLHIGEEGWHNEWLKNPRWEPPDAQVRRFDGLGKRF